MPDYFKLLKQNRAPAIENNSEDETLAQLNKFSQANKTNLGPNTSLNVPETITNAYNTSQDLRSKALDKIAEATDFGTPIVGPNEDYRKIAKQGLDVIAPNITDLVPLGKLGAVASLGIKEGRAASKGLKTAEEMMQGLVRPAQLEDLKKSSNLIGQPVFKTAEEKAANLGKVITPDMANVSDKEIRTFLDTNSPSYKELLEDRNFFKTNPEAYSQKKDYYFKKAREFLTDKKLKGL